tara:strand:- start:2540 stop:3280 length:741 start_codon:yes stop_codon:yes gene_type:complete
MYFEKFPKAVFTLDNYKSGQILPNLFKRVKFVNEVIENLALYDLYTVPDGETPEITADVIYGNPQLHWIILHTNKTIDPRFEWPMSNFFLKKFADGKYGNASAIHHYENASGNVVNGNVRITTQILLDNDLQEDDVLTNNTNSGTAFITKALSRNPSSNRVKVDVTVTGGGFQAGDYLYNTRSSSRLLDNTNSSVGQVLSAVLNSGLPVTNEEHEERLNEDRRLIKILSPEAVPLVIQEFDSLIKI